ncbi:hypothetical protein [Kocuria sp. CPCC 204721]|uniref:hypothetical protein n=1 Tax=Kocuria sp. CPCC 204721 TaxID=3073548 RepID=UPI0034D471F7
MNEHTTDTTARVAIVTGIGQGIGAAIAEPLHEATEEWTREIVTVELLGCSLWLAMSCRICVRGGCFYGFRQAARATAGGVGSV